MAALFINLIHVFIKSGKFEILMINFRNIRWSSYVNRRKHMITQEQSAGMSKERGIITKIDRLIDESGWRNVYSYLSSELYISICVLIFFAATGICYIFTYKISISLCIGIMSVFIWWLVLYISAISRYKKIENQLMIFINLLQNYSKTSDDLVDIISKCGNYLEEPLKFSVLQFQWEATHTGEIETALSHLKEQLPHRKLREIIQNLDMCRRHEANYEEVINDMRVSVQHYIKSHEECNNIRKSAKANILVMMIVGIIIIRLVNGFVDGGVFKLLCSNVIGIIIIIYIAVLCVAGIWQFIKLDRD